MNSRSDEKSLVAPKVDNVDPVAPTTIKLSVKNNVFF